jgi:hypothetical protein
MEDLGLYFTDPAGDDLHTAATLGTKSIPLGVARNIGVGSKKLYIVGMVTVALTTGGKTQEIDLVTATDAALTQNLTTIKATIMQFPALAPIGNKQIAHIPEAALAAVKGAFLQEKLYLGIKSQSASGDPATGSYKVFLSLEPGAHNIYPTTNLV